MVWEPPGATLEHSLSTAPAIIRDVRVRPLHPAPHQRGNYTAGRHRGLVAWSKGCRWALANAGNRLGQQHLAAAIEEIPPRPSVILAQAGVKFTFTVQVPAEGKVLMQVARRCQAVKSRPLTALRHHLDLSRTVVFAVMLNVTAT